MSISIERLNEKNFADYETLTSRQAHGGCYCSFWHQKWQSMADWEKCQKETPDINRQMVFEKMRSGFHVGVLAYQGSDLLGWLSVGPLIDFYWTWRRVIQVGEDAKAIAGITCFTIATNFQGKGLQSEILEALKVYGKQQGWKAIEGYPFDESALEKHKKDVIWPGLTKGFEKAGFTRTGPHWLSNPEAERSIFTVEL
ncbi:MAG: hypothetical protein A2X86_09925 [Bdellovibrionales bacterium GWA2_49_15]|nr:MAG: hypothetical protein A2X86_09925 [Bdellovibrionales bacterium GWA2_49_15]HAZ13100.1 hypothetical protein [Bdellovibrionales bacterium]